MTVDLAEIPSSSPQLEFTYNNEVFSIPIAQNLEDLHRFSQEITVPVLRNLANSFKKQSEKDKTQTGLAIVLFSSRNEPLITNQTSLIAVKEANPTDFVW